MKTKVKSPSPRPPIRKSQRIKEKKNEEIPSDFSEDESNPESSQEDLEDATKTKLTKEKLPESTKGGKNDQYPKRRQSCLDSPKGQKTYLKTSVSAVGLAAGSSIATTSATAAATSATAAATSATAAAGAAISPLIVLTLCAAVGALRVGYTYVNPSPLPAKPAVEMGNTISEIQSKFSKQDPLLWRAVDIGINDTITMGRPSSYIFLHESGAESTTQMLLKELSEFAACKLTECDKRPVKINTSEPIDLDYGSFLNHYRNHLQESGVMVVQNLEGIPDQYALAFHFFCDEVTPAVEKSAIFFSMKVDKFKASPIMDLRYIENTLREKWKNIEEDKFGPLFTRITAMPLRVHPEEEK